MKTAIVRGKEIIVDDEDLHLLQEMTWTINRYVTHWYRDGGITKRLDLHRLLMAPQKGYQVDHINGNVFDNRKINLRICTAHQNAMNIGMKARNTSGYKGVSWSTSVKRWVAQIGFNNKRIRIGAFDDPLEASLAYQEKAKELFGEFARNI